MNVKILSLSVNAILLSSIFFVSLAQASNPGFSSITYNGLNNAPKGDYIWFNAKFKAIGIDDGTIIYLTNSKIAITKNNQNVELPVPNAIITFSSAVTKSTTSFDSSKNAWITTVPLSGTDNIFLTGLLYQMNHLNDNFNKVTVWSGDFSANKQGVSINWQYGVSVYTNGYSYNDLGVQASHNLDSQYKSGTDAGTPHKLTSPINYLVSGGSGGGGSNWCGSMSSTASVVIPSNPPTDIPEFPSMTLPIAAILGLIAIFERKKK